jgi:hypothetical protein
MDGSTPARWWIDEMVTVRTDAANSEEQAGAIVRKRWSIEGATQYLRSFNPM